MSNLKRFFTALNLHLVGVVVLAGVVVFLAAKLLIAFHDAGSAESASFAQEQIQYAQLKAQMSHLQGLPDKVKQAGDDAQRFYEKRFAPNYSTVLAELGAVEVKNQARLTRAQYGHKPAIDGLTEVRIDANVSGDYSALMHFINDLERDKDHVFFIINGVTLTGQQGGMVNLRLIMTTYLQAGATDIPAGSGEDTGADASEAASNAGPGAAGGGEEQ